MSLIFLSFAVFRRIILDSDLCPWIWKIIIYWMVNLLNVGGAYSYFVFEYGHKKCCFSKFENGDRVFELDGRYTYLPSSVYTCTCNLFYSCLVPPFITCCVLQIPFLRSSSILFPSCLFPTTMSHYNTVFLKVLTLNKEIWIRYHVFCVVAINDNCRWPRESSTM